VRREVAHRAHKEDEKAEEKEPMAVAVDIATSAPSIKTKCAEEIDSQ
jgi:hypothetical protein